MGPPGFGSGRGREFDPKAVWLGLQEEQLKLIGNVRSDFHFHQMPFSSGRPFSVVSLMNACNKEVLHKLGMLVRAGVVPVHPEEWRRTVVAVLQDRSLPPPPPDPLQESLRKSRELMERAARPVAPKAPPPIRTPLSDEIHRAIEELKSLHPEVWSEALESDFRVKYGKFHGDEVVANYDARDRPGAERILKGELRRRHKGMMKDLETLRSRAVEERAREALHVGAHPKVVRTALLGPRPKKIKDAAWEAFRLQAEEGLKQSEIANRLLEMKFPVTSQSTVSRYLKDVRQALKYGARPEQPLRKAVPVDPSKLDALATRDPRAKRQRK